MLVGKISPKGIMVPLIFPHLDVFSQETLPTQMLHL